MKLEELRVAVLGTGLAGAYAYRALRDAGLQEQQIQIFTAQHHWCPELPAFIHIGWVPRSIWSTPFRTIQRWCLGVAEWYAWRRTGLRQAQTVAVEWGDNQMVVYDTAQVLRLLWDLPQDDPDHIWSQRIHQTALDDQGIIDIARQHDLVIQTFASDADRRELTAFTDQYPIIAQPRQPHPSHGLLVPRDAWAMVYNGLDADGPLWARAYFSPTSEQYEFSSFIWRQHPELNEMLKETPSVWWVTAIRPDCPRMGRPLAKNILLAGRFATWNRTYVAEWTYGAVVAEIHKLLQQES